MRYVIHHDTHLQYVENVDRHRNLMMVQKVVYPKSNIITPDVLKLFHDKSIQKYIDTTLEKSPNAVCYMLPQGTHGADSDHCCNGIRYQTLPSDYVSLPQINLTEYLK